MLKTQRMNKKTIKPIIIIGAGGHASVVVDTLKQSGISTFLGFINISNETQNLLGIPFLGDDSYLERQNPKKVLLALGIGSIKATEQRKNIFCKWKSYGFDFVSVIHPSAVISPHTLLGEGVQIFMGTLIQTGAKISENVILNTGSQVDHDCQVQAHSHLAPRSVLSGNVCVGECSHIGTGAAIMQEIHIGNLTTIAAGAVVVSNIPNYALAKGIPARFSIK